MTSKHPPIVLGAQLAAARAADQDRIARGNTGASPIGPGMQYDFWSGQLDLGDPVPLPLDERLVELCRRYADSDADSRAKTRSATGMNDFYTLLTFSRRAAVFAMRGQPRYIADGLTAIAMIEARRTDPRDVLTALGVLAAAAASIGEELAPRFGHAAELADIETGDLIRGFLSRPASHRQFGAWGYALVEANHGPGLIRTDSMPYQPTRPLHRVALDLAQLIRKHRYQPDVTIATSLPPIWLSGVNDAVLRDAIGAVVAGATVHGRRRPNVSADHESQALFAFVVETADEPKAQQLLELSRAKAARGNDTALLGVCHGRLFCLMVGRCIMVGRKAYETQETILRFAPGMGAILKKHG